MKNSVKTLLQIDDMVIAKDIQSILEESNIYCVLISDNPASSIMNVYSGFNPAESVTIQVNESDYPAAVEAVNNSFYKDLLAGE